MESAGSSWDSSRTCSVEYQIRSNVLKSKRRTRITRHLENLVRVVPTMGLRVGNRLTDDKGIIEVIILLTVWAARYTSSNYKN